MKKPILTLICLMFALTAFGQAWKEARAEQYAAAAKQEFKLNDAKTAEIKALWIARLDAFTEVGDQAKAGKLTDEQRTAATLKVANIYREQMSKIMRCTPAEYWKFNNEVMKKLNSNG